MKILLFTLPFTLFWPALPQSVHFDHSTQLATDTLRPQEHPARPGALLHPIEFREIPYTYTTTSHSTYRGHTTTTHATHTGIRRIYSYNGIDVDNPQQELWPYMDAVNDPDVADQHIQYENIVARQATAATAGTAIAIPGLIMMILGASQAKAYRAATTPTKTGYTTTTTYQTAPASPNVNNCSSWTGSGGQWTCWTGPYAGQTVTYDPFNPPATTVPIQTTIPTSLPQTSSLPDGQGLLIGGTVAFLAGVIISVSAKGDAGSAFLKAVQYYNRAVKQKFSWEMQPYYQYGASGFRLVGHF